MILEPPSLMDINTGYPGFAYNFDAATQTCDVQLAIEDLFVGMFEAFNLHKPDMLQHVPVQFIQGGGWSLTHPVPDGTPVYVHFAHRGTDHYYDDGKETAGMIGGQPSPAFSQRFTRHSCVCVIGIQPNPSAIPGFNADVAEFRNGDRSQRLTLLPSGNIEIVAGSATAVLNKDGSVEITSATKITGKAPEIVLDGNVTVTKNLTLQGNVNMTQGGGTFEMKGNINMQGTYTLNGFNVGTHVHNNPEGGIVGPMRNT